MILLSEQLLVPHSSLSTEVHLIVYSFVQPTLAELPVLCTRATTVNTTDTLPSWSYIPVGGTGNERVKMFLTSGSGKNSVTV